MLENLDLVTEQIESIPVYSEGTFAVARPWPTGEGLAEMCNGSQRWRFGQKRQNKQTNKNLARYLEKYQCQEHKLLFYIYSSYFNSMLKKKKSYSVIRKFSAREGKFLQLILYSFSIHCLSATLFFYSLPLSHTFRLMGLWNKAGPFKKVGENSYSFRFSFWPCNEYL